jgi:hypothetical protein
MQRHLYKGMSRATMAQKKISITAEELWYPKPGDWTLDPSTTKNLVIKPNCDNPTTNATICDPRLRTMNTLAECGSADDYYFFSPWRAPGSAPVIDACGSAGGRLPGQGVGGGAAAFQNSSVARQGDVGSKLPQMAPQAVWRAGSTVEVGVC